VLVTVAFGASFGGVPDELQLPSVEIKSSKLVFEACNLSVNVSRVALDASGTAFNVENLYFFIF
jgi:hypothetical protein